MFVDRVRELGVLEREYAAPGFRLVVVYGRRRVGKTRLLREWLRGKRGVYFVAAELSYRQLSSEFSRVVGRELGVYVSPDDLVAALEELADHSRGERLVVVLDEFQYLVEADPSLPSRLMRSIDSVLGGSTLMLVLCGSAVSFFERELLGYRAPLFGRRTAQLRLRPMRLREAYGFLSRLGPVDALRAYSVLGGTPAYLGLAAGARGLRELLERVVAPGSPLLDEAPSLLRQEVREPRAYMSLLKAVAQGYTRVSEAAQAAGVDPRSAHHYFAVLEELDIVARRAPLGYRRGQRVFIVDDYFRFWFRYMPGLQSLIEAGYAEDAVEHIAETLDQHASETFALQVEAHLPELHVQGVVPTRPVEHGPWWHRGLEIDLVVREPGRSTTFVEVKWSDLEIREAMEILDDLEEKAVHTGLAGPENYYVVVARSVEGLEEPLKKIGHRVVVDYSLLSRREPFFSGG